MRVVTAAVAGLVLAGAVAVVATHRDRGPQGIAGVVVDARGAPVARAVIAFAPDRLAEKFAPASGAQGQYRVALPPGDYDVWAQFDPANRTAAVHVHVARGRFTDTRLTFPPGAVFPPPKG